MKDDSFCNAKWTIFDIAYKLNEMGIPDSETNVAKVRDFCIKDHNFIDRIIDAGWEIIEEFINILIETGEIKNNETT